MAGSRRDVALALWGGGIIVVMVLLVLLLRVPGLVLAALVGTGAVLSKPYFFTDPEVESLRASLLLARDDIAEILAAFDDLRYGDSTEALADRTLHVPALAQGELSVPEISEFWLRASAAQRFIQRIDAYLGDASVNRFQLERLIQVADQRAMELELSWVEARRVAGELGPG